MPNAAPSLPPLTGASSHHEPASSTRPARRRVSDGLMVEWSTTRDPGAKPASTPASPWVTSTTSGVSETQIITTVERSATSRGDPATAAPIDESGSVREAVRFQTVT